MKLKFPRFLYPMFLRPVLWAGPRLLLAGLLSSSAYAAKSKRTDLAADLFAATNVLRLAIEIPPPAMEALRAVPGFFNRSTNREKVQVTIREGDQVYTNVTLQLKGAAGSFRAIDDKPAFTLNFEKLSPGQTFYGLEKLSLNNSVQDPTYASEQVCRELFLQAGVPVPRATPVRVSLNGHDLGPYVLLEGWDRRFLKNHFADSQGHLYDGGFVRDIAEKLSLNAGKDPDNQSDREALAEAAKEPDPARRKVQLEKVLDVDRFLTLVAMDVLLWNWDGYAMNRNNWRLYHDVTHDKMVFMPHGLDQMFWKPEGSILPTMNGLVAKAVLGVPEFRQRYFARLAGLRESVLNPPRIVARIREVSGRVRPILTEADPAGVPEFDRAVTGLCEAVARREKSLAKQLSHPIEPEKFDANNRLAITGWQPSSDFGAPLMTRATTPGTTRVLEISTTNGSSIGTWRVRRWLEQGSYRMEVKIKTQALTADPGDSRAGAGIRIGKARPEEYRTGDTEWALFQREFAVEEPIAEVAFFCEFRGLTGHAQFDLDSLQVVRLPSQP